MNAVRRWLADAQLGRTDLIWYAVIVTCVTLATIGYKTNQPWLLGAATCLLIAMAGRTVYYLTALGWLLIQRRRDRAAARARFRDIHGRDPR